MEVFCLEKLRNQVPLVDCHPRWYRVGGHLRAVLLLLVRPLPSGDMRFQTLVKVEHASNGIGNS